jgi:hypothetical protein
MIREVSPARLGDAETLPAAAPPMRRRMVSKVFLTAWLVYTVFWTPWIVREHFPALTLAERGTLNVEPYLDWTEDIFRGPNGGAFINNNPGASLAGATPLILLRPALVALDHWNQSRPAVNVQRNDEPILLLMTAARRQYYFLAVGFLTVALVMAPATAYAAAYLCSCLMRAGVSVVASAQAALVYCLGTPVFYRAAHLNHNLLVCDAGFVALLLLWDQQNQPLRQARTLLAGLLAGFAFLCDYSGLVVIVVIAAYVFLRATDKLKLVLLFSLGVLPMIAALLVYQQWAFGSFYHPSQHFMTPTEPTSQGYRGIDWPSPALLWANFFDPRFGLFAYCPALLLAFAAPFVKRPKLETSVLLGYFVLFVIFCASNRYSWLQALTGFRYLVPVVPALFVLAFQTACALPPAIRRVIISASLVQSVIMAAGHQNTLWKSALYVWDHHFQFPWMVRLSDLGVPVNWVWPAVTYAVLTLLLALLWGQPFKAAAGLLPGVAGRRAN